MNLNCKNQLIPNKLTFMHSHKYNNRYRSINVQEKKSLLNIHFKMAFQLCRSRRIGMLCVLVYILYVSLWFSVLRCRVAHCATLHLNTLCVRFRNTLYGRIQLCVMIYGKLYVMMHWRIQLYVMIYESRCMLLYMGGYSCMCWYIGGFSGKVWK